jgi:hypothetical protein
VRIDTLTNMAADDWRLEAPAIGASREAFDGFWRRVQGKLAEVNEHTHMLLLATERWPRSAEHYPQAVESELIRLGAGAATLAQWKGLTQNVLHCPLAGVSYALIGSGGLGRGLDAFAAGFGEPGRSLNPTADVVGLLPRDQGDRVYAKVGDAPVANGKTQLVAIQSNTDGAPLLMRDPGNSRNLIVAKGKPGTPETKPGQFWFFHNPLERYGWRPYVVINFENCGCIQGSHEGKDAQLSEFPANFNFQDDILWDRRGQVKQDFHMLLLHWHSKAMNLSRVDDRVKTEPWKTGGMSWKVMDPD